MHPLEYRGLVQTPWVGTLACVASHTILCSHPPHELIWQSRSAPPFQHERGTSSNASSSNGRLRARTEGHVSAGCLGLKDQTMKACQNLHVLNSIPSWRTPHFSHLRFHGRRRNVFRSPCTALSLLISAMASNAFSSLPARAQAAMPSRAASRS